MNLNIRELIDGRPSRLRYVYRYSTTRVQHPESVAEHSYFVVLYSMMIGRWVNSHAPFGRLVDMSVLLQKAAVHDLEEAVTGDFPREFKHSSGELKQMLSKAGSVGFLQLADGLFGSDDNGHRSALVKVWEESKDSSSEGAIVEFADFLSVLSYIMQEGAISNNQIITRHIASMDKYFMMFDAKQYDFIRELIQQASDIMEDLV